MIGGWRGVWRSSVLAALCALALSCGSQKQAPLTEIMVVVRSNISTLSQVQISVDGLEMHQSASAMLDAKHKLPRTLGIAYEGGPIHPIIISATGYEGAAAVVERKASVSFVPNRNVTLVLDLVGVCAHHTACPAEQTCGNDGNCGTATVDGKKLQDWPGSLAKLTAKAPPPWDAGPADAGESAAGDAGAAGAGGDGSMPDMGIADAGPAQCKKGYAMCSTHNSCTKLGTTSDCSDCGGGCSFATGLPNGHGTWSCQSGMCTLACANGFQNLNAKTSDGCETPAFIYTPSNIDVTAPALRAAVTPKLTIGCVAVLDTSTVTGTTALPLCTGMVKPLLVTQAGGAPELVVISVLGLDVAAGSSLTVTGTRPVVFVVFGDATVSGTIDVSAVGTVVGAGGDVSCTATTIGANGADNTAGTSAGGGGGGFGSAGGNGGKSNGGGSSAAGGMVVPGSKLVPLRGGCAGGHGGTGASGAGGSGGAGGGAVQISATGTLTVTGTGTIAAAGGGGRTALVNNAGGGAGGSGGAVLLEAATIDVAAGAWLSANGGGGAEGNNCNSSGNSGADGAHAAATVAAGGSGGASNSGKGGNGAAGGTAATGGGNGGGVLCYGGGGGGGGGVGVVQLNSPNACPIAGTSSPAAATACP